MAGEKLSHPLVYFTDGEHQHCLQVLKTIAARTANLERLFAAAAQRSGEEFAQAEAIIRGLPPEGGAE